MKKIVDILEKPKTVITALLVVAVMGAAWAYKYVGQEPVVSFSDANTYIGASASTTNSVDLAFPKSGRISALSVEVGKQVKKGYVLASIDAGDALGAVNQAKGALDLAKAQYASLNIQYANTKKQQDVLVENAYRTLLSTGLIAVAKDSSVDVDKSQTPTITGTYTCDKEGIYEVDPYASNVESGYSYTFKGLESGVGNVLSSTPQPLGNCGLFIQFPAGYSYGFAKWVISIPNTRSTNYATNKNAYDLALATRDQVLKQLEANLGNNGDTDTSVAKASINSAQGAYEVALANYNNSLIIAPMDGVVTSVDSHLKVGQSILANKAVITISK